MKHSGRNLKRRLYGLTQIGNRLSRIRHFRGHGVHSPFVYSLVRKVFMHNGVISDEDCSLLETLVALGMPKRRAVELQNCMTYCDYSTFSIDSAQCSAEFNILTDHYPTSELEEALSQAAKLGTTLVVMFPYLSRERKDTCLSLITRHISTSVDNGGYILFFNNYLPKQHYRL